MATWDVNVILSVCEVQRKSTNSAPFSRNESCMNEIEMRWQAFWNLSQAALD